MPGIQPDGFSLALTVGVEALSNIADASRMIDLLCELLLMEDMTVYCFLLGVVCRAISISFILRSRMIRLACVG